MTANAVISGNYADFKLVKTRGVCQLVVEIPIEQAEQAVQMFGIPRGGEEIAVALARLITPLAEQRETPQDQYARAERSAKAKLSYLDKSEMQRAATRAAMLCRDVIFQAHLETPDADACAERLREMLGGSRSRIGTDEETYRIYLGIETDYRAATNQIAERRG